MPHFSFFLCVLLFLTSSVEGKWLPLQRLSQPKHKGIFPQIALDSNGNQVAVWQGIDKNHSVIQASIKPDGGKWQSVADRLSIGDGEVGLPQIVIDQKGRMTVIWDQFDGKNFIIHTTTKSPKGKWQQTPDQISSLGESAFHPRLTVDPFGNLTAIWEKFDGKHFIIQTATKPVGGAWKIIPQVLSSLDENASFPQVIADSEGNVTAIWHQCGQDRLTRILTSWKPYGGSWQEIPDLVSLIDQEAFDLQVTVDACDVVTVVWNGVDGRVWASQKERTGKWQIVPDLLSSPNQSGSAPQVAADGLGRVGAVWVELKDGHSVIRFAIKKEGNAWQMSAYSFSDPSRNASFPQIAMNEKGDISVAWCEREGQHERIRVATKQRKEEWKQETEFISPSGHHALFPRMVLHSNGMPVIAWQQFVYQEIFIQIAEKRGLLPPRYFNGWVICKHFTSSIEYCHLLKWEKSLSRSVDHYLLFQNRRLIAKIPKNQHLQWIVRDQSKDQHQSYTLVAVDREGKKSLPLQLEV